MDKCLSIYDFEHLSWTFICLTYKCPEHFTSLSTIHFKLTIIIMYCECFSLSPLSRLKFCCLQLPQSVYSVGGFATETIIQRSATPASVLCPWVRNGHYAARSGAANPLTLDLGFVPRGWTCRGYTVDGPGNRTSLICSCGRREKTESD